MAKEAWYVTNRDGAGLTLYFGGTIGGYTAKWVLSPKRAVTFDSMASAEKTQKAFDGKGVQNFTSAR